MFILSVSYVKNAKPLEEESHTGSLFIERGHSKADAGIGHLKRL
jgi:hypothetical protein